MKNCTTFYTAEKLNEILGWNDYSVHHSKKWNTLREQFFDMDEDQFNEIYHAFCGTSGEICKAMPKKVNEEEANQVSKFLNAIRNVDFPISFSDAYYSFKSKGCYCYITRERIQKIVDALDTTGKIEGLRVIRIMTQGTCHIKLYEIR